MPLRSLGCALALATLLPAQGRKPAFGAVLDAAGAAAAACTVTFVGTAWFGEAEAPTDVVQIATDARGTFVAQLLSGRVYSAWAATAADAGGRFGCSDVQDVVLAGSQLSLRLQAPRPRQRVQLRGREAWAAQKPLRLEVMPGGRGVLRLPVPADSGLAPLLPPIAWVLVLDRDGLVLWQQPTAKDDTGRLPTADLVVDLPPPRTIAVQVDDAAGRPIAGAVIDHGIGELRPDDGWPQPPQPFWWRRAGSTDRQGRAVLQVPALLAAGGVHEGVHLRVRAAGFAEAHAGTTAWGAAFVDGTKSWTASTAVLSFALQRAAPLHLEGAHAGDEMLLFATMATGDRIVSEGQLLAARTALLPTPSQLERGSLVVVLPQRDGPWFAMAEADGAAHHVDLRARQVRVTVRKGDKGPAQGVLAVALRWDHKPPFTPLLPVPLDQGGHGRIALGGGDWLILATADDAIGWRSLRQNDGDQDWQIDMQPMPIATARVFGASGTATAGARVDNVRLNIRGDFAWDGERGALATILMRLQPRLLRGRRSDAQGLVRLPLFPLACWSVGVQLSVDGATTEFADMIQGEVVDVFR